MSNIFEGISFECPVCLLQYNESDNYPYMICKNQHAVCLACLHSIVKYNCPQCREQLSKEPTKFRLLSQLKKQNLRLYGQTHKKRKSFTEQIHLKQQLQREKKKNEELEKTNKQINEKYKILEREVQDGLVRPQRNEYKPPLESRPNITSFSKKQRENREGDYQKLYRQQAVECDVRMFLDPQCYYRKDIKELGADLIPLRNAALFGKKHKWVNFTFHVQIITNSNQQLGLGVIDSAYKNSEILNNDTKNWITYQNRGWIWDGEEVRYQGRGFREGETVTIFVNALENYVEWLVGTESICKCKNQKLFSMRIKWVPFIGIQKNDKIKIWVEKSSIE